MPLNSVYVDQLVGRKEVQFDLRKFQWIGSPAVESVIFYIRADTPYQTIADVIKAKEAPKCGLTGTASSDYILSKVLEETVGAKFNTVQGYPGGSEIDCGGGKRGSLCAAPTARRRILGGSRPIRGTRKISIAIWCRPPAREIHARRMCRRPRKYSISTKCRPIVAALRSVVLAAGDFGRPMIVTPALLLKG